MRVISPVIAESTLAANFQTVPVNYDNEITQHGGYT